MHCRSPKQKTFVEYTLFSHNLLKDEQYEAALEQYIAEHLKVKEYSVTEKEFGVIPMTNYRFSPGENNLINIGSAGGKTKGSSGYTFQNIQKHSAAIVSALMSGSHPLQTKKPNTKFDFYDSVLLNILHNKTMNGGTIFHDLFKKNKPQQVLKFLDNETSLKEDVTIMSSLPTIPFAKAALDHLF
jgi:lycopene beta-cyclase